MVTHFETHYIVAITSRRAIEDIDGPTIAADLVRRLRANVVGAGDVCVGEVGTIVSDDPDDLFIRNEVMVRAEVTVLRLRNPNPFPVIDFVPRWARDVERWARNLVASRR